MVCAWYPITPATSLADAFESNCARYLADRATKKKNYAIVQAENEVAAIGVAVGAGWNGARAFTATSGPGISLMQKFFCLAYFRRISGRFVRRSARRSVDRHADPHPAVGPSRCSFRVARRHQACAVDPGWAGRDVRVWCERS
jgi:pyruvate/2-oxoacid:ferredoxin oxidoreductase alpha subunit